MSGLKDRVNWFTKVPSLRTPVVLLISAIEEYRGHAQILGTGLCFYLLCKGGQLNPFEVLQRIDRMEQDADAPFAKDFAAMKEYARHELNR